MKQILSLLSQSWMCYVARKVNHRKYLQDATSFRTFDFKHLKCLSLGQRNLLEFQMVGEQFTSDVTARFSTDGENKCKWCGLPDSRQHRFEECVAFSHIRKTHPGIMNIWLQLPMETRFFSLWPCDGWQIPFQALLSLIQFRRVVRVVNDEIVHLFVDGSCQHQAHPDIRISSGSVIRVLRQAGFEVVWSGMTPSSDQQSLRGEIIAGCIATASYRKCWIYIYIYRQCHFLVYCEWDRKCLTTWAIVPPVPKDQSDLWIFFLRCLQGSDLENLTFVKVKGHLDWKTQQTDYLKWTAWYNNLADLVAKQVLTTFRSAYPEYVHMCRRYFRDLKRAEAMALYHVDVAEYATSGIDKIVVDEFGIPVLLQVIGEVVRGPLEIFHLDTPTGFNDCYLRCLQAWACNLTIYKYSESGFEDTSWLECYLIFLWQSRMRPPVCLHGVDRLVDEHPDTALLEVSFADSLKTFRRYVSCIERCVKLFPEQRRSVVTSMKSGGRSCPGFGGRICIDEECEEFLKECFTRHCSKKRLTWPMLE